MTQLLSGQLREGCAMNFALKGQYFKGACGVLLQLDRGFWQPVLRNRRALTARCKGLTFQQ